MHINRLSVLGMVAFTACCGFSATAAEAAVLIGNTRGNNVVRFDEKNGQFLGEFIAPFAGFEDPDTLIYGPDGDLYISAGKTPDTSAIYRFDPKTGASLGKFASGSGLFRPYGLAFGPDGNLYVSSFLSDQILRYDGTTGAFIDVFAARDGSDTGLNGPNGLLFGPEGDLYVTTQGSVAVNGVPVFGKPSQILRYDIATGEGEVFAPEPTPAPNSGFVSFLGLAVGPEDGDLYVSDFANGIRQYDFETGALLSLLDTNYTETSPSSNFVGNLAFGPDKDLYSVGFEKTSLKGSLFKFDRETSERTLLVKDSPELKRPIGLLFEVPVATPEPSDTVALLGLSGLGLAFLRKVKH